MTYTTARDPVYSLPDLSAIDLTVTFDGIGEVPFTARADDPERCGRDLFTRAVAGDFGEIGAFPVPTLDAVKSAKISSLRAACAAAIVGGFACDALGAAHTYPSKDVDQRNLLGSVTASILPGVAEGWTTPFWCADASGEWGYHDHTVAQIQAVGTAAKAHIVDCQTHLALLTADVDGAVDADAVAAIVWG